MRFLFGDRELWLGVMEPINAPVEAVVCATTSLLEPADNIAHRIHTAAGEAMQQEKAQLLKEHSEIASGMAMYTTAGDLPHKALVHAVMPLADEDDHKTGITQAVSNSLLLCETNDWTSIAFPVTGTNKNNENIATSAQAFFHAITRFWDARFDCSVIKIMLCANDQAFQPFFDAFREQAHNPEVNEHSVKKQKPEEQPVGFVDLSENDTVELDEDIQDWFK
jgi:O-acetyl-ADP-ribose deacetylase (regulator of RNase III)